MDVAEAEIELGWATYRFEGGEHWLATPDVVINVGFAPSWELVAEVVHDVWLDREGSECALG